MSPRSQPGEAGSILEEPRYSPLIGEGHRGKTVLVTGGATGLGRSICLEFGRIGCNVAFCFVGMPGRDVREQALLTETTLSAMGVGVYADVCDVRDRHAVAEFVYQVCDRFDTIHYLVNNAGIANDGALWRLSPQDWAEVMDTNLTGAFNCISAVAPIYRGQRYGKIVSVSTHQADHPGFGVAPYAASKAGLEGADAGGGGRPRTIERERECRGPGIRADRAPGAAPGEVIERAKKGAVLGRIAEPSDVAQVVAFSRGTRRLQRTALLYGSVDVPVS
jgi:3-oxoacyl-[acyl-carrier protein] reductase